MRALYSLLFVAALPLILIRLLLRSRKAPAYRERILERFGFGRRSTTPTIWIHAVSVGEVQASRPLIGRLQQFYPHHHILITTMTPTGAERVEQIKGNVHHRYVPYDTPGCIKRFLARVQPKMLIVMETEIWPNMLHYCKKQRIPTMLANARMSEKSAQGYARFATLVEEALSNFSQIAVQNRDDEERLIMLGADPAHIHVTGSLKFDFHPPRELANEAGELRKQLGVLRKVFIAASTHKGEDEQILDAFEQIRRHLPETLLILVPRHPERFDDVAELCINRGLKLVRRSQKQPCHDEVQIFLGDSMGELMLMFAASDVAFVGGSLVPTGGHNLLEPASLGLPVLTGPHMFNFAEIHRLLQQGEAAIEVETPAHLAREVIALFKDDALRESMGENGKRLVEENRGALDKVAILVESEMKKRSA